MLRRSRRAASAGGLRPHAAGRHGLAQGRRLAQEAADPRVYRRDQQGKQLTRRGRSFFAQKTERAFENGRLFSQKKFEKIENRTGFFQKSML